MSSAGWYPDPGNAPGRYRYWDGRAWAPTTSPSPGGPAAEPPGRGSRGWLIGIAALVIVLVGAIIIWFSVVAPRAATPADANSASPTVSSWDERQPTTPPPPIEAPSGGTLISCPDGNTTPTGNNPNDGWLQGGGLKVRGIPQWRPAVVEMGWVYDMSAQTDEVYRTDTTRWFSMLSVGALRTSDGFRQPKLSAFQVMSCFATSHYYSGYTGRKDILSEAVTIGGRSGWHLRSEVYVQMAALPQVKGDWIDIIVVDTGNPESLGVFIASVTIDDNARMDLVEAAIATLTTR